MRFLCRRTQARPALVWNAGGPHSGFRPPLVPSKGPDWFADLDKGVVIQQRLQARKRLRGFALGGQSRSPPPRRRRPRPGRRPRVRRPAAAGRCRCGTSPAPSRKPPSSAGLERATPHDLRRSFCSLAGRRGVDPIEAAQITGHSPAVWAKLLRALVREGAAATRRAGGCSSTVSATFADSPMPFRSHRRHRWTALGTESPRLRGFRAAPRVGLEPTTLRLTAGCSAN